MAKTRKIPNFLRFRKIFHYGSRADENFPLFSYLSDSKNQTIIDKVLLANDKGNYAKQISIQIFRISDLD